ncbi:protein kinase domain containing protein [Stylonychia lemnae]|uniref:Protein kinase domain containing protein n=1 Tax=Stylonychia lemnae TaxID=5949 RepID=A0A078BAU2_STYLE|nr:protein kinase domain containing protein [Stylonychia lemnae]|eukprot:CDW91331.1 protein kinase domain containing protein [Stylonychia lemnae]
MNENEDDDATIIYQAFSKLNEDEFKETNFEELLNKEHVTITYSDTSDHDMTLTTVYNTAKEEQKVLPLNKQQTKDKPINQKVNVSSQIKQQIPIQSLCLNTKKPAQQIKQANVPPKKQGLDPKTQKTKVNSDIAKKDGSTGSEIKPVLQIEKSKSAGSDHLKLDGGVFLIKSNGKSVIVNQKMYNYFGDDCVDKIAKNQTLIFGSQTQQRLENKLETTEEIIDMLKMSQHFKHIENIQKLAEGGEAIVYKLNYIGYDEVVIKVPKIKNSARMSSFEQGEAVIEGFVDLITESQLIKSIYHEDYLVEVKEEIIEIDLERKQLMRYLVIVERARYSLYDLYSFKASDNSVVEKTGLWFKKKEASKNLERFSVYKFYYYFYQAAKAIEYLHDLGIIYSDFKPQNLLVMRNQKVKIGDFGVSILTSKQQIKYKLRGLSPQWCIPEIRDRFNKCQFEGDMSKFYRTKWSIQQLKLNDYYALGLTFYSELIRFLVQKDQLNQEDEQFVNFFGKIGVELALQRSIDIKEANSKLDIYLMGSSIFLQELITILKNEKKYEAAYEIGRILRNQYDKLQFENEKIQMSLFYLRLNQIMCEFKIFQGDYLQAIEHIKVIQEKSIEYLKNNQDKDSIYTIQQLQFENQINYASILLNLGNIKEGEIETLKLFQEFNKNTSLYESFSMRVLQLEGQFYMSRGDISSALPIYQKYSMMIEKMNSSQESQIHSFMKLGEMFSRMKDYQKSLKYYQQANELLLKEYGVYEPINLECLQAIGNIYLQLEELDKATTFFNQALEICQTIFGERNVKTAETYRQFADLFNKLKSSKAIFYYEKAKSIYEFLYEADNIHCVVIFNNLGGLYLHLNDQAKAEEMCLRSLAIKRKLQVEDNLDVAYIYQNLSRIKIKEQNMVEALRYMQLAYDIKLNKLGPQHQETLDTLLPYLKLLCQVGKVPEALNICLNSVELAKAVMKPQDPALIQLQQLFGQILVKSQQLSKAEQIFLDLLNIIENGDRYLKDLLLYKILRDLGVVYEVTEDERMIDIYKRCLIHCDQVAEEFGLYKSIGGFLLKKQKLEEGKEYLLKSIKILEKYRETDPMMKQLDILYYAKIETNLKQCDEVIAHNKNVSAQMLLRKQ